MVKRINYSTRNIISLVPNLQVDELGLHHSKTMNLTFPEFITVLKSKDYINYIKLIKLYFIYIKICKN